MSRGSLSLELLTNNDCKELGFFFVFVFVFNFLAKPYGMWGLSSPARDHICGPCFGSRALLTGPPGKVRRSGGLGRLIGVWGKATNYSC